MFLHGLDGADIRRGDTIANPQFLDKFGQLQQYDICVSNPPYSIKDWEYEIFKTNKYGRLTGYEQPPQKNADFAFVMHMIKSIKKSLRPGGVVCVYERVLKFYSEDHSCSMHVYRSNIVRPFKRAGFKLIEEKTIGQKLFLKFQII